MLVSHHGAHCYARALVGGRLPLWVSRIQARIQTPGLQMSASRGCRLRTRPTTSPCSRITRILRMQDVANQLAHLLQDHEDPQDAGCSQPAHLLPGLFFEDPQDAGCLECRLAAISQSPRPPDRGSQPRDLRSQPPDLRSQPRDLRSQPRDWGLIQSRLFEQQCICPRSHGPI